jgi:hypothetical protein
LVICDGCAVCCGNAGIGCARQRLAVRVVAAKIKARVFIILIGAVKARENSDIYYPPIWMSVL